MFESCITNKVTLSKIMKQLKEQIKKTNAWVIFLTAIKRHLPISKDSKLPKTVLFPSDTLRFNFFII